MAQPFPHTLRSLQKDSGRAAAVGLLALLVAALAWTLWLFGARVTIYEVSKQTRLEVRGASLSVHSVIAGKIDTVSIRLGQSVKKGDVLFVLDSLVEQQRLASAQARLQAIEPQVQATVSELRATRGAVQAEGAAAAVAAKQAKARSQEAAIGAKLAEREAQRYGALVGAVSQLERERVLATAEMRQASSAALSLDVKRSLTERKTRLRSGEARIEGLRRELTSLQGEQRTLMANVAELEQQIARHTIRAPADGTVGEVQALQVGAYVSEGSKLATLLPRGDFILVAEFDPASALGRVREQQRAELRLTGFPWLQYGAVPARVSRVAAEPRDGTVRVELDLLPAHSASPLSDPRTLIPFQHGLPGTVEIAVEEVSPATLVLRSLGRRIEHLAQEPASSSSQSDANRSDVRPK
ncbi:MAG: HlyD family efflux transporter periplasmic adaptor subunit [Myxococcales bacterium]|nr:HlyD family efflux transporter periplasmic adaptor subunit [Myxococcales bacterium]